MGTFYVFQIYGLAVTVASVNIGKK
jgi:hypothetical protein